MRACPWPHLRTSRPAGPLATAEVMPVIGCVSVDGCGDGRMMTYNDRRVNDGEAVTRSPGLRNSPEAAGSGSEYICSKGSTLSLCPLLTRLWSALPLVTNGCLQPVLHAALPSPCPSRPVPRLSVSPLALLGWPLPPVEHGPLPGDAGLCEPCCLSTFFPSLCPTPEGVLTPPCGERHVLARSSSIGELRPTLLLVHTPLDALVHRCPNGLPLRGRVASGPGTLADPAGRCYTYGSALYHVSAPLFSTQFYFSYRYVNSHRNSLLSRV